MRAPLRPQDQSGVRVTHMLQSRFGDGREIRPVRLGGAVRSVGANEERREVEERGALRVTVPRGPLQASDCFLHAVQLLIALPEGTPHAGIGGPGHRREGG